MVHNKQVPIVRAELFLNFFDLLPRNSLFLQHHRQRIQPVTGVHVREQIHPEFHRAQQYARVFQPFQLVHNQFPQV